MHPRRPELGLALVLVVLGLVAILGLAFTGTSFAAPPPQGCVPGGTVTCPPPPGPGPEQGGPPGPAVVPTTVPSPAPTVTCVIGNTDVTCAAVGKTIMVPAGAVVSGTVLTITGPVNMPPCPPTPNGQVFLGHCFQVQWTGPNGAPVTFSKPVQDCFTYTANDVSVAGGNAANLVMGFVTDAATMQWTLVKPTVDSTNSMVCASMSQPFVYQALFTPALRLPVTGSNEAAVNWAATLVLAALAAGAFGYKLLRTAR